MVGAMTTALVISQSLQSKEFVRSDMVAAKVLQNAMKEGRGAEVLAPKAADVRTEGAAKPESKRVEAADGAKQAPVAQTEKAANGLYNSASIAAMREKIGDMTRALEGLKSAFEAMTGYNTLIMESDSATAIAYAGNVLENVEREAAVSSPETEGDDDLPADVVRALKGTEVEDFMVAEGDLVHRVEAGASDDGINAKGEVVRHVSGGSGSDGVFVQAGRAVNILGGSGDDAISVEARGLAWGVSGGSGDDKMHVMGRHVGKVDGGTGDDVMSVQGLSVKDVKAGAGDDRLTITGRTIRDVSDGDGDDVVSIIGDKLDNLRSSAGDDVYNLNVGSAKMSLREGMGQDVVNMADGMHLKFVVSETEMMEKGAVNAVWEGDNLVMNFENGDSLTLNNAAKAGSISMRAGDTQLTLMPPKTPAAEGLLDIAV